jgi:polysaccharide export outer membrane protein
MIKYKKAINGLLLCLVAGHLLAADERLGVPTLEDKQRREAITAADQDDKSLPPDQIMVVKSATNLIDNNPSQIEKNVSSSLNPVSLEEEIQTQTVQSSLELFGYEMFSGGATTFPAISGAPVPLDYVVGPGDTFTVQAFSAADVQYTLTVTREGLILVPESGAISVSGLTFKEAKQHISESIETQRIGIKTVVTLSELRSIQVMLVGEVTHPGSYTVSGFSTLVNTLASSGGIKRTGSLRKIKVNRGGQTVATMDLYKLLLKGNDSANIYLRQGDLIFVPPIGPTVGIAGEVLRPAIYELESEKSVGQVLSLAGGLLPTANKAQAQIERVSDSGLYTLLQADLGKSGKGIEVQSGDLIRVLPVLDKMDGVVLLSGHVLTPGGYQWKQGMRIADLFPSTMILRQGAEFAVAMVQRENRRDKRTEVIYFNLGEALANRETNSNILLQPRDQVIIFNTHSPRAEQLSRTVLKLKREATADSPGKTIELKGFLRHPGTYPMQPGTRLLDMINNTGGLQAGLDLDYALLARTDLANDRLYFVQVNLRKALRNTIGDHNPLLQPLDKVYLFDKDIDRAGLIKAPIERLKRETNYGDIAPIVQISGFAFHPGAYPMVPGMRVEDLIIAAGGMKEEAFGTSATLTRQVLIDNEFSRTETLSISLAKKNSLLATADSILHPNDQLFLRPKPEWAYKPKQVSIEGEVIYPGRYRVDKRETLCALIQKVGGFTEDAYLFGTVFLRDSIRKKEQNALDRMSDQLDRLLADVHISPGVSKDEKMTQDPSAKDVFSVIKQLSPEKALGRMVIDMERAVTRCDELADIVLEDGDRIIVPKYQDEVSVVGQVYFSTSHKFRSDRAALDYIALSGGTKELAQNEHAYIVQANGEVMSIRSRGSSWGRLFKPSNVKVTPGATIYVPLSVDRINGRESYTNLVDIFYKNTLAVLGVVNLVNRYGH